MPPRRCPKTPPSFHQPIKREFLTGKVFGSYRFDDHLGLLWAINSITENGALRQNPAANLDWLVKKGCFEEFAALQIKHCLHWPATVACNVEIHLGIGGGRFCRRQT